LVDEVLAVGDINFQKKCLGKMGDVARAGRTVVLVTHQLNQIRRLCHRVLWIDAGSVRLDGNPHDVLAAYESEMFSGDRANGLTRNSSAKAQFLSWEIAGQPSERSHVLSTLDPVAVHFAIQLSQPVTHGEHGIALFNAQRQLMWASAVRNLSLQPGLHL